MATRRTKVVRLARMLRDAGVGDDHGCIASDSRMAEGRHEWYPEVEMLRFGKVSVDVDEWYSDGTIRIRATNLGLDDAVRVISLLQDIGRGK